MDWKIMFLIFMALIFPICLVAAITFLTWYFNNYNLMWWYIAAVLTYFGWIGPITK